MASDKQAIPTWMAYFFVKTERLFDTEAARSYGISVALLRCSALPGRTQIMALELATQKNLHEAGLYVWRARED